MCLAKGEYECFTTKIGIRSKGLAIAINMKHKVGNLAMLLKILIERMSLSCHKICT